MTDTFTARACRSSRALLHVFIDNEDTMRREAVSIHDGSVAYWVSACVLEQMNRRDRLEILGSIADAPWGTFIGRERPAPQNDTNILDRMQSSVADVEVDITRPLDEQCVDGEGKQ